MTDKKIILGIMIIGILAVSGCTQTSPNGTYLELCDNQIPINRLNVQIVDDFGELKENVTVVAFDTVNQREIPVAIGQTDENGQVTMNYSFLQTDSYEFNAYGEDILPDYWNIPMPCLGSEYLINLTNENNTVGLEYDIRLEFRRWGHPQITFFDEWYLESDVINVYKKAETNGEIIIEEVNGIIYEPVLEFRLNRGVEAFVFVEGIADDRLCYENCQFRLQHEDLSEDNKYFGISLMREYCGQVGEVCLDDTYRPIQFGEERIWLDREPSCITIIQECDNTVESINNWDDDFDLGWEDDR